VPRACCGVRDDAEQSCEEDVQRQNPTAHGMLDLEMPRTVPGLLERQGIVVLALKIEGRRCRKLARWWRRRHLSCLGRRLNLNALVGPAEHQAARGDERWQEWDAKERPEPRVTHTAPPRELEPTPACVAVTIRGTGSSEHSGQTHPARRSCPVNRGPNMKRSWFGGEGVFAALTGRFATRGGGGLAWRGTLTTHIGAR